jgi:hypothetical protein
MARLNTPPVTVVQGDDAPDIIITVQQDSNETPYILTEMEATVVLVDLADPTQYVAKFGAAIEDANAGKIRISWVKDPTTSTSYLDDVIPGKRYTAQVFLNRINIPASYIDVEGYSDYFNGRYLYTGRTQDTSPVYKHETQELFLSRSLYDGNGNPNEYAWLVTSLREAPWSEVKSQGKAVLDSPDLDIIPLWNYKQILDAETAPDFILNPVVSTDYDISDEVRLTLQGSGIPEISDGTLILPRVDPDGGEQQLKKYELIVSGVTYLLQYRSSFGDYTWQFNIDDIPSASLVYVVKSFEAEKVPVFDDEFLVFQDGYVGTAPTILNGPPLFETSGDFVITPDEKTVVTEITANVVAEYGPRAVYLEYFDEYNGHDRFKGAEGVSTFTLEYQPDVWLGDPGWMWRVSNPGGNINLNYNLRDEEDPPKTGWLPATGVGTVTFQYDKLLEQDFTIVNIADAAADIEDRGTQTVLTQIPLIVKTAYRLAEAAEVTV